MVQQAVNHYTVVGNMPLRVFRRVGKVARLKLSSKPNKFRENNTPPRPNQLNAYDVFFY